MITKLYLAGASAEIDRARKWASALRDADITVLSTWVEVIGKAGAANPADATPEQLTKWTLRDEAEVHASDLLWLLLPAKGIHTVGAYIELGLSRAWGKHIVMSGTHRPIFTPVFADISFATDEEAFEYIQTGHRTNVQRLVNKQLSHQEGATRDFGSWKEALQK